MYLVEEGGHAVVIDPFQDVQPAGGRIIDKILLTHEHYDHISGVTLWKEKTGSEVLCSAACAENIRNPRKSLARFFGEFCQLQTWIKLEEIPEYDPAYSCTADEAFQGEMKWEWRGHHWDLFEMPGHSLGSIGILLDEKYFFSGDSLFENYDIETHLPGGSEKKWIESGAPRLAGLPEEVWVFPGHFGRFQYRKKGEKSGFPIQ